MKTIQVTDEIYAFLSNLSKEIKSQDNRATAPPYFFQVQEDEEIAVPKGCGEEAWACDGEICLRTEEDIKNAIFEWKGWESGNHEDEELFKKLDYLDIERILNENYKKVNVEIREKYSNCFLTFKAYQEHVSCNAHNLNNPKSYLFHAYRNSELDMLFKFLLFSF